MDFATFAAWVTIFAVILAIPLSVIANLLTPKIQIWWAGTAKRRAIRRLKTIRIKLEQLDYLDEHPVDAMAQTVCWLLIILIGFFCMVSGILFALLPELAIWVQSSRGKPVTPLNRYAKTFIDIFAYFNLFVSSPLFFLGFHFGLNSAFRITARDRSKQRRYIVKSKSNLMRKYPDLAED